MTRVTLLREPAGTVASSNEPIYRAGVDTSYWFDGFTSYADTPANLSNGSGDYTYVVTEAPTFSSTSPVGSGGRKIYWARSGGNTGGIIEQYPSPAATSAPLIITWLYRSTAFYEGKGIIPQDTAGHYRYVCQPGGSRYPGGWGDDQLESTYWDGSGNGLFADTPPMSKVLWMIWHDGFFGGLGTPAFCSTGTVHYQHNINDSLISEADYINSASLVRHTLKLTPDPVAWVDGHGRLEMWIGGTKTHEYLGDDNTRPEYGMVLVKAASQGAPVTLFKCGGPTYESYAGPANIEWSDLRVWRQAA